MVGGSSGRSSASRRRHRAFFPTEPHTRPASGRPRGLADVDAILRIAVDAATRAKLDALVAALEGSPLAGVIASVLLTGSQARGEAAGELPVAAPPASTSDFDVYVITEGRVPGHRLRAFFAAFAETARASAESFRVDLHVLARPALARLPPVIRYFDLQRDSRVLAGEDLRGELVPITAADLSPFEGLRRMLNAIFFFFEKVEAQARDGGDPLAYLYREAAHGFAVAVGTYGAGLEATLGALAGSPYGARLAAQVDDFGAKFRSASAPADWACSLRDFAAMIDCYAACAYGTRTAGAADDELRAITPTALAPYVAWTLRRTLGVPVGATSGLARLLARVYLLANRRFEIYWRGRLLLERVAHAGPAYAEASAVAADVACFRSEFTAAFLSSADSRTVIPFGAAAV